MTIISNHNTPAKAWGDYQAVFGTVQTKENVACIDDMITDKDDDDDDNSGNSRSNSRGRRSSSSSSRRSFSSRNDSSMWQR